MTLTNDASALETLGQVIRRELSIHCPPRYLGSAKVGWANSTNLLFIYFGIFSLC